MVIFEHVSEMKKSKASARASAGRKRQISGQEVALSCSSKFPSNDTSSSSSSSEHDSSSEDERDTSRVDKARRFEDERYQDELSILYKDHQKLYSYWSLLMANGFNIILLGVGSKRQLIEDFRNQSLRGEAQLVINAHVTTLHQILVTLDTVLEHKQGGFKSHLEHCRYVCQALVDGKGPERLFIVIHSIDGLRNEPGQQCLALLANCPVIHVLASTDHVNGCLLWDQTMLTHFNWVWFDCTTFRSYHNDQVNDYTQMHTSGNTVHTLDSVNLIINTLTSNAQKIFELIARQQLDQSQSIIVFQECYHKCRERFLVSSEQALTAQLTEFKDHKLITMSRAKGGNQEIRVTLDNSLLKNFLDQHQSE